MTNTGTWDTVGQAICNIAQNTSPSSDAFVKGMERLKKTQGIMLKTQGVVKKNWMCSRDVIDFLGIWECLHNPEFNRVKFEAVKNEAGSN